MTNSYVYIQSEWNPGLYTVGFYSPNGTWNPESDHNTPLEAAKRVNWLNGGNLFAPKTLEEQGKLSDEEYTKLNPRQLDELGDDE